MCLQFPKMYLNSRVCRRNYSQCFFFKKAWSLVLWLLLADGLAWDWVNKKLYWTDYCANDIEVYDPSTGYRRVLITTGSSSNPRGIVVDPRNRY